MSDTGRDETAEPVTNHNLEEIARKANDSMQSAESWMAFSEELTDAGFDKEDKG